MTSEQESKQDVKLMPCPFCGSEAKKMNDTVLSSCSNENCEVSARWMTIKEWNTRHSDKTEKYKEAVETLAALLLDPEKKGSIMGSEEDNNLITQAMEILKE